MGLKKENYEVKDLDVDLKQCYKDLADAEDNFGKHEPTIEEETKEEDMVDPVSGEVIKEE